MNTKTEIDIEFKRAMEQADELEELSGILCGIGSTHMDETLTLLTNSWKGQNADDYLHRTKRIKDKIYDSAQILNDTAQMIRKSAQRIYMAEMAAISICEIRW